MRRRPRFGLQGIRAVLGRRRISGNEVRTWSYGNDWTQRPGTRRRPGSFATSCVTPIPNEWKDSTMKWNVAYGVSTVITLALATLLAGQAHADCSGSQRISHEEAGCLEASWDDPEWDDHEDESSSGIVKVTNECASYGAVVVKVQLTSCTVKTIHRTLSTSAENWIYTRNCDVEGVFCCKDRGDLCNISDVVSADSCLDQFSQSIASETCENASALHSPTYSADSDTLCTISAQCERPDEQPDWTGITVEWLEVPDVLNCDGELKLGAC